MGATPRKGGGDTYGAVELITDLLRPSNFPTLTNLAYTALAAAIVAWPSLSGFAADACSAQSGADDAAWWPLTWQLAAAVCARNLAVTFVVYSTWHYLTYERSPPLSTRKFNPRFPPPVEHEWARRWTMVGAVVASAYELFAVWAWARPGAAGCYASAADAPLYTVATWLVAVFVSDVHFWLVHRLMHPWGFRVPLVGDVGGLLYRHVHYFHHLRYNPGPWAGLAMHPIEHIIYFSRSLWALAVPIHPAVFVFSNIRAMIGPAPGHHGFEDFYGSRFHLVHHHMLRCNYGTRADIDRYFGTYKDIQPGRSIKASAPAADLAVG